MADRRWTTRTPRSGRRCTPRRPGGRRPGTWQSQRHRSASAFSSGANLPGPAPGSAARRQRGAAGGRSAGLITASRKRIRHLLYDRFRCLMASSVQARHRQISILWSAMSRVQLRERQRQSDEASASTPLCRHRAAKRKPGYANFASRAAAQLVLLENPGQGGTLKPPRRGSRHAGGSPPSRPGWPERAWPRWTSGIRPAATPGRTSSGSPAPRRRTLGDHTVLETARPSGPGRRTALGRRAGELDARPGSHACCGGREPSARTLRRCLPRMTRQAL